MVPCIPVIAGPTGSGKTKCLLSLSDEFPISVISADSRQIYRGMDIGTAKPGKDEQKKCPHYLIDIIDPPDKFSAADFAAGAKDAIHKIMAEDRIPVTAGGSGLYIKALTEGFFEQGGPDPSVRKELQAFLDSKGPEALFRRLQNADPESASEIHPNNSRRVMRALEIFLSTGKTRGFHISQQKLSNKTSFGNYSIYYLDLPRKLLYENINRRVDEMIEKGLVSETENLLSEFGSSKSAPVQTIGYKETAMFLQGKIDLDKAVYLIKKNTRNYAKRQVTWFRKVTARRFTSTGDLLESLREFFKENYAG
ncbi:MAG: tRNA (adenosine(37)-N6)-dimethylallyltransferase MiaA [Fibrobacterota bacterium]